MKMFDMQYYIVIEDMIGKLLFGVVLYVVDCGVCVWMLVDDLNFDDIDCVMVVLNMYWNIEICVFNLFGVLQCGMVECMINFFMWIDSFMCWMYNKVMIVDNQIVIVGGCNFGDEYFSVSLMLQFCDFDVFVVGLVMNDILKSFDDYWVSVSSYLLCVFNYQMFDLKDFDVMCDELCDYWCKNVDLYNVKLLNVMLFVWQIVCDEFEFVWVLVEFEVDVLDKVVWLIGIYVSLLMQWLVELMCGVQKEFFVFLLYFVLYDVGVKIFGDMIVCGVCVVIVMNLFVVIDVVVVQVGYVLYCVLLLQCGVELYEFKLQLDQQFVWLFGLCLCVSLYVKVYVIDW